MENNESEYDESLTLLLVENGFNHKNIRNLTPVTRVYSFAQNIPAAVNMLKEQFKDGCIFSLSSGRRNNMFFVYHTPVSPDEIRRRLELKAFL